MIKTLMLNCISLTNKKQQILDIFFKEYLRALNLTLNKLTEAKSSTELHHLTYYSIRETSFLPSDIIQEARKDVWAKRKTIRSRFKRCSIRLNRKWFKFFETERGTPCFRVTYSPGKSFVIPIRRDGGYIRFRNHHKDGWRIKCISLLHGEIAVCVEKEFSEPIDDRRFVVGVDVGSYTLSAVTILDAKTGKIAKQLYFGRDVAVRQRGFTERSSKLSSNAKKGSKKAKKYLKRLKQRERNFVRTRSGQIAKEIVNLSLRYNASVTIEKLRIEGRKGKVSKRGRKKINKIPYAQFRDFLRKNCLENSIPFQEIDAYHTSKWCPACGALNRGHSSNYALYKCGCGLVVNSDRKASLAIAVKSALVREFQGFTEPFMLSQVTRAGGAVNHLFRPDDEVLSGTVYSTQPSMESPVF